MKFRFLSFSMAALAAVALCLAGCGGEEPSSSEQVTGSETGVTPSHKTVTVELHVESLISGTLDTEPVYEVTISIASVTSPEIGTFGPTSPLILEGAEPGEYDVYVSCPDHENVEETFTVSGEEPVYIHTIVLKPYNYVEPDAPVEIGMYKHEYFQDGTTHLAQYDSEMPIAYQYGTQTYWFGKFGKSFPDGCRAQSDPTKLDCSYTHKEDGLRYISGAVTENNEQFEITVYKGDFDSEVYVMGRYTRL